MNPRTAKDAKHEVLVIRAKLTVAQLVSKRPLAAMTRAELRQISEILIDAAIDVAALEEKARGPASRGRGYLELAAEDGELTAEGQAIVDARAAERERRRARRAVKHA